MVITTRCTLKCKLCGGYMPYIEHPRDMSFDDIKAVIRAYFGVVDTVGDFCVTGGEPLMHKDLSRIIAEILKYKQQIGKILVLTNGTLIPDKAALELLSANTDKCKVTISHYGALSRRADELKALLEDIGVPVRLIRYYGDDLDFGGWVNYIEHHEPVSEAEAKIISSNCSIRQGEPNFCIYNGVLYSCGRSFRRMELGLIPRDPNEYVDFLNETAGREDMRRRLLSLKSSPYGASCAFCVGLSKTAKRYPPAEQITPEELEQMRGKI